MIKTSKMTDIKNMGLDQFFDEETAYSKELYRILAETLFITKNKLDGTYSYYY